MTFCSYETITINWLKPPQFNNWKSNVHSILEMEKPIEPFESEIKNKNILNGGSQLNNVE